MKPAPHSVRARRLERGDVRLVVGVGLDLCASAIQPGEAPPDAHLLAALTASASPPANIMLMTVAELMPSLDLGQAADLVRTMPAGSLKGSVLTCDDLEKTVAELAGRGVTFNEDDIQEAPWGRWKTCDDPDGNGWIVQQNNPDFGS